MQRASEAGITLIKRFEGLRLRSYRDVAGVWTVGYGHTGPEVGPDTRVTRDEAEALLRRDLMRFEAGVADAVTASLTQGQFDALVSLAYNIGVAGFRRSTALRRLNRGDYAGAAEAMTWWDKATIGGRKQVVTGLARRRAAEAALFLRDEPRPPRPAKRWVTANKWGTAGIGLGALAAIYAMGTLRGGQHRHHRPR